MGKTQISAFIDYLVGFRPVGVNCDGEEIAVPNSPEARAFMIAQLGENVPSSGYYLMNRNFPHEEKQRRAMAIFFANLAFSIDPTLQVKP